MIVQCSTVLLPIMQMALTDMNTLASPCALRTIAVCCAAILLRINIYLGMRAGQIEVTPVEPETVSHKTESIRALQSSKKKKNQP